MFVYRSCVLTVCISWEEKVDGKSETGDGGGRAGSERRVGRQTRFSRSDRNRGGRRVASPVPTRWRSGRKEGCLPPARQTEGQLPPPVKDKHDWIRRVTGLKRLWQSWDNWKVLARHLLE